MSEDMQQDAVDCATVALDKYVDDSDIAEFIKKGFDGKYNPSWHCVVGRNFGSYVTHEIKHFIYFYIGQDCILIFFKSVVRCDYTKKTTTTVRRQARIKNADMSEEMQQDAVDCATQALEKYNIADDIAAYIKKEFDRIHDPTWPCIVVRNFGSSVSHEAKHYVDFFIGQVHVLLFKPPMRFSMSECKAIVKDTDMSEDMQQDAIDLTLNALQKFDTEQEIANFLRNEFERKYDPAWHCFVGRNFSSYVTHETKHFIYFYLAQFAVLLFKSG